MAIKGCRQRVEHIGTSVGSHTADRVRSRTDTLDVTTERPRDRLGRTRSPASVPGFLAGRPSPSKGRRRPAEVLTAGEIRRVFEYWPTDTATGVRNRAIVRLIYWEGLQPAQALNLEPGDWIRERGEVVLPPRKDAPRTREGIKRRTVGLSASTRELLEAWWTVREALKAGPHAPLFTQVIDGRTSFNVSTGSFRSSLQRCGSDLVWCL